MKDSLSLPALPNEDAADHIKHVLSLCTRDEAGEAETVLGMELIRFDPPPWEFIVDDLEEEPGLLVIMGFLTPQELDECRGKIDEQWLKEVAFSIYEQNIESSLRNFTDAEHDYEGIEEEGDDDLSWFDEEVVRFRDLILDAKQALDIGDHEQLISVIDSIFGEIGEELESLGQIEHWAQLLVNTSVAKTDDDVQGSIEQFVIHAVRSLAVRLCEIIALDGRALQYLEWRQLEEVIAVALDGIGFEVILTPPSKDGGKDVIANCIVHGRRFSYFIEIKHWRSGKRVGSMPIFDFVEININSSSDGGLFLSTSGFGQEVFTHLAELERSRIRLGDVSKVVGLCQHFTRYGRGIWTASANLPEILFEGTMGSPLRNDGC